MHKFAELVIKAGADSKTTSRDEARQELSAMPVMMVNPFAKADNLASEAGLRLDAVKEMLQGLGATGKNTTLMTEDFQGACSAAAYLIGDAITLQEHAMKRAKEDGDSR